LGLAQYNRHILLYALVGCLADTMGVIAITIAFSADSSAFVSAVNYVQVVYAFISDVFFFNENFVIS
jgi:hypothetical protein